MKSSRKLFERCFKRKINPKIFNASSPSVDYLNIWSLASNKHVFEVMLYVILILDIHKWLWTCDSWSLSSIRKQFITTNVLCPHRTSVMSFFIIIIIMLNSVELMIISGALNFFLAFEKYLGKTCQKSEKDRLIANLLPVRWLIIL